MFRSSKKNRTCHLWRADRLLWKFAPNKIFLISNFRNLSTCPRILSRSSRIQFPAPFRFYYFSCDYFICILIFFSFFFRIHRFDTNKSTKGASKLRRDLINAEIANLRDLLPLPQSTRQRLSQLQLMALVCVYVRKANYFQQGKFHRRFFIYPIRSKMRCENAQPWR